MSSLCGMRLSGSPSQAGHRRPCVLLPTARHVKLAHGSILQRNHGKIDAIYHAARRVSGRVAPRSPGATAAAAAASETSSGPTAAFEQLVAALTSPAGSNIRCVVWITKPGKIDGEQLRLPLAAVLRYPGSKLASMVVQESQDIITKRGGTIDDVLSYWDGRTLWQSVDDGIRTAVYVHEHGTLCGAPMPSDATLIWLRTSVLEPYGLPDILDLPYNVRLFNDKSSREELLALHREAAVQEAVDDITAMMPVRDMVLTDAHAAFVLVPSCDGTARIGVYRLVGGLKEAAEGESSGAGGKKDKDRGYAALGADSEFEAWDGTAAHHWPALPPGALDGPVGLRPEVCEAVARALERLPAGLRVQLVEVGVQGAARKARVLHVTM